MRKLIPAKFLENWNTRANFQKIVANTGWLIGEKLVRMLIGLFVGIWVARYLGPDQFGQIMYVLAMVSIFSSLAGGGINSNVVRDLVQQPQNSDLILGSSLAILVCASITAYVLVVLSVSFFRGHDSRLLLYTFVIGGILIFGCGQVIKCWFESSIRLKFVVQIAILVTLVIASVRVYLILSEATLIYFIWVYLVDAILVALGLIFVYSKYGAGPGAWRVSWVYMKSLLSKSWPLLVSSFAIMLQLKVDQVMIGNLLDTQSVGIYNASVRITEIWLIIPFAIITSLYPSFVKTREEDYALYTQRLQKVFDGMVIFAILIAIPITFTSNWLITILFGDAYSEAGAVLKIQVWSLTFAFLGQALGTWFVLEQLQRLLLYRCIFGVCINIVANWILIPILGVYGAAIATLISYAFMILSGMLHHETIAVTRMVFRSFALNRSFSRILDV